MSGSLNLALRITGDAGQLRVEVAGAAADVRSLGTAAQQAGGVAVPAFNSIGDGGRRAGAGFREASAGAEQANRSLAVTSNQMRQLAPQINDVVTQLALGQSPLMILAAQGGQITQVFGGVRATMSALVGVLGGPFGVAALGAAAGLAAIGVQAERQERALIANSVQLRRTRDDYLSLASSVEQAARRIGNGGITSTGDARDAGLIIAGQRRFSGDSAEIERLTRLSADLARVMGVDVPTAAERFVAKAIADPARAAREATDGGLRGFDEALVRQVQRMQASGDTGRATTTVLEAFGRAAGGAAGEMTQVQSAWTTLMNSIKAGLETISETAATAILRAWRAGRNAEVGPIDPRIEGLPSDPMQSDWPRTTGGPPAEGRSLGDRVLDALRLGDRAAQLGRLRDATQPLAESEARYGSVPGRPPIGSTYREPDWAAGLPRANGRLWQNGSQSATSLPELTVRATGGEPGESVRAIRPERDIPSQRSDQAALLRPRIDEKQALLDSGLLDPETARRAREELQELRRQYVSLESPLEDVNRQLRDQTRLAGIAGKAAQDLASAEISAREATRRAGGGAAEQEAAAAEARGLAQQRLNSQLDEAIRGYERQRQTILAGVAVQRDGTVAAREDQIALQARTEALNFGAEGSAAYQRALERLTVALRGVKEAQDQAAIGPLVSAQGRAASEVERQRGLIGAGTSQRAVSDAEAAARERLRGAGISASGSVGEAYIAEERRRAENILGLDRERAAYNEFGREVDQIWDRIGEGATRAAMDGKNGMEILRNTGTAVASELYQWFLKLALLNPLKNALLGKNEPTLMDVGSQLLGSVFGIATGTKGDIYGSSQTKASGLHSGGRAGSEASFLRLVDPAIFAGAPRFHDGRVPGLSAGEIPAILRDDEFVFTPEQMGALGGRGDANFYIDFSGDAGSERDRARLIEGLRSVVRQEIGSAAPGIVNTATGRVADLARRGGSYSRDVGRR